MNYLKAANPSLLSSFCTSLVKCWKSRYRRHEHDKNDSNNNETDNDSGNNTSPTTTNVIHNYHYNDRTGSVAESTSGETVPADVIDGDDVKEHVELDGDRKNRGTWSEEDKDTDDNSDEDTGCSSSDDSVVIVTNHSVAI